MTQEEIDCKKVLDRVIKLLVGMMVILFVLAMLASCTTTEYVPVVHTNTEHHWHTDSVKEKDSTYHEKTTVIQQLDSAAMAKYGIQLKEAERAWLVQSRELEQRLMELEHLTARADTVHDSIPVPVPVIKPVPADLSWWQRTQMYAGDVLILCLLILLGYGCYRLWRVYRKFYT